MSMNKKRAVKNQGTKSAGLFWVHRYQGPNLTWTAVTEDGFTAVITKKGEHVYTWTITSASGETSTGDTMNEAYWHAADDIAKRLKEIKAAA